MFGIGPMEMMIIGGIAVLLFGKNLPQVARSIGSSYQQFRKGLTEIQSEVNTVRHSTYDAMSNYDRPAPRRHVDDQDTPTAPKFEPPPSEPDDQP